MANDSVYVPLVVWAVVLAHVYAPDVVAMRQPVDRHLVPPVRVTVSDPVIDAEGATVVAEPPFTVALVTVAAANTDNGAARVPTISAAWSSASRRKRSRAPVDDTSTVNGLPSVVAPP